MKPKRKQRPIKIVECPRLTFKGRPAWGLYWKRFRTIEIDSTQRSFDYCTTLVHEFLHHFFPVATENRVDKVSMEIAKALWKKGFRRTMR